MQKVPVDRGDRWKQEGFGCLETIMLAKDCRRIEHNRYNHFEQSSNSEAPLELMQKEGSIVDSVDAHVLRKARYSMEC